MAPEINLASFGNMTPHVHWHVIPRYRRCAFPSRPGLWHSVRRPAVLAARRALLPALHAAMIERLQA
jgi:diadenosine tetraphosphate (Ap4A) HIT family hydrolase